MLQYKDSELQNFLLGRNEEFVKADSDFSRLYAAIDGEYENGVSETTNAGFESEAYLNLDNAKDIEASWNVTADSYVTAIVDEDGTFSNIVSIRSKRMKGKKLEKWEEEFYRENRKMIDLPQKLSKEEQEFLGSDWQKGVTYGNRTK